MEYFLNKVSQQAVSFAIRTGIVVTSQFALKQCGRYISSIKGSDRRQLQQLQERLDNTIRIVSPAIDLVEIISARGNTSLESALTLTKNLRHEIQELGVRLSNLTAPLPDQKRRQRTQEEVNAVIADIKAVLQKIEEAVPFISLAVTTSGVNISSSIPHSVSPSRLLQASTLLTAGDTAYTLDPFKPAQIGTSFTLSLYMLFSSHAHRQEQVSASDLTWQEVISKCRVKLQRVPLFYEDSDQDKAIRGQHKTEEYCYELCLIEDLDDGRVHEATPVAYEDVAHAGLRVRIPVHQIAKMFYTTSGKLLGIEESSSPILLIKRDKNAIPPRRLVERAQGYEYEAYSDEEDDSSDPGYQLDLHEGESGAVDIVPPEDAETSDFPPHLDPEWLAFEVFQDPIADDSSDTEDEEVNTSNTDGSLTTSPATLTSSPPAAVTAALQNLSLVNSPSPALPLTRNVQPALPLSTASAQTKSTLSILECLLRLTILQNYQQTSHLSVHDELLNLFLSDAAWDGNPEHRAVEREKAKMKLGFDPFGSSPVSSYEKRRSSPGRTMPRMHTAPPGSVRRDSIPERRTLGIESSVGREGIGSGYPRTPGSATRKMERGMTERRERIVGREREERRERRERRGSDDGAPWTPDRQLGEEWGLSPLAKRLG